jgi:hypothetical protein
MLDWRYLSRASGLNINGKSWRFKETTGQTLCAPNEPDKS